MKKCEGCGLFMFFSDFENKSTCCMCRAMRPSKKYRACNRNTLHQQLVRGLLQLDTNIRCSGGFKRQLIANVFLEDKLNLQKVNTEYVPDHDSHFHDGFCDCRDGATNSEWMEHGNRCFIESAKAYCEDAYEIEPRGGPHPDAWRFIPEKLTVEVYEVGVSHPPSKDRRSQYADLWFTLDCSYWNLDFFIVDRSGAMFAISPGEQFYQDIYEGPGVGPNAHEVAKRMGHGPLNNETNGALFQRPTPLTTQVVPVAD